MKVALVQDWFTVDGGAEKVIREILNLFKDLDVFGLIDDLSDQDRLTILDGKKVHTSFIQRIPLGNKLYRNFLPLFPTAIEQFDFSSYDLVISSSYAVAKGVKTNPNQIHICYCHTPIRYAWDLREEYLSQMGGAKRWLAAPLLDYVKKWDYKTKDRPTQFIANSAFVAERIKRIYGKDAKVIYPPVDTKSFAYQAEKEDYYITSARLVPYKKVDLIVKAFAECPDLELKVSGDGPQLEYLKEIATPNVSFTGFVSKNELISSIQNAKAFLLAAEEDFGITSIEAQSCGTPVIALNKGGYKETIVENKTGIFFDQQTAESIRKAILQFEKNKTKFKKEDFEKNVHQFSIEKFRSAFAEVCLQYDIKVTA